MAGSEGAITAERPRPTVNTNVSPEPRAEPEPEIATVVAPADTVSPSSEASLARFEFETGMGNEGTKILMVEWESDGSGPGAWEVSWEGKTTVLPAADADSGPTTRVFFLLPPGAPVPPQVRVTQSGASTDADGEREGGGAARDNGGNDNGNVKHIIKTLPAIFPPELLGGKGGPEPGKRGVLHTIWARQRLAALDGEVKAEMRTNGEGVGLQMVLQEREWIMEHFGLLADGQVAGESGGKGKGGVEAVLPTPVSPTHSPRSPLGGRLGEKLRGLKLATSPADLVPSPVYNSRAPNTNYSVSNNKSNIAVSSFPMPKGVPSAKGSAAPGSGAVASLDAMLGQGFQSNGVEQDTDEDLFALPMSPRSPEMAKSPFSLLGAPVEGGWR